MKPRIMTCDDHPHILKLVEFNLNRGGYDVISFPSADAAWPCIEDDPPTLLVCDCEMPGMSGLDLCRRLRMHPATWDVPIILLTGRAYHLSPELLEKTLGVVAILEKPFSPRHLRQLVDQIVQREEAHSTRSATSTV